MRCVTLAGELGTRTSEETVSRQEPMIEIGGRTIHWHIMQYGTSVSIDPEARV